MLSLSEGLAVAFGGPRIVFGEPIRGLRGAVRGSLSEGLAVILGGPRIVLGIRRPFVTVGVGYLIMPPSTPSSLFVAKATPCPAT